MTEVLQVLTYAVSLAFILLGALTFRDYLRHRERSRGFLALAIGLLAVTNVLGEVQTLTGNALGVAGQDLSVAVFLASGYALLLFRGTFIRLGRRAQRVALAAVLLAAAAYIVAFPTYEPKALPSAAQAVVTVLLILVWSACVTEPIVRFWLASGGRPAVQRGRLRSLAVGYGLLVGVLLFAGIGQAVARHPVAQLMIELLALVSVPLLYLAFAPPRVVRREWMYPEEAAYRDAVRELLLFSPTRQKLAERALDWAIRFVGAEVGFIADSDGSVLAAKGMDEAQAERLTAQLGAPAREGMRAIPGTEPQTAVVVPLPLAGGTGVLAVISGPFTPFFGTEEVARLAGYATNVTAGLDRAILTERIAALERTKTEFLNLASHELRGPITVIRGYLSMLERGSLGEIPESALRALPVLTAKADEMNALVEQMIEAARLEEGRLELSPRRADLREVARIALEMAQPFADAAHALVFESPDIEIPVSVDVDRISTVIGNLLTNAIKYSPGGGPVTLKVSRNSHVARISVTDTGVGIPPDRFDRLFTRFGRIVTPETSHIPGTGLGLYLSRELARLHGGDITATSTLGKGSTFVLAVPLAEE
ncbi:MAG: HAMP domain-containing histidine kinase [Candidatus Dormibacteraeota bacterium]|nr:HAMP domain-containing histidine kinase [Candidatus Dormibacteraeota bacterium]